MSLTINSNISSLGIQKNLDKNTKALGKSLEALSSGKRINRAADDAAGQQIAAQLTAELKAGSAAARNISEAVSTISVADGALSTAGDITAELGALATQASNGTLTDAQRGTIDKQFQALSQELDRIAGQTEFGGRQLLGSTINVQSGTDGSPESQTQVSIGNVSTTSLGIAGKSLATAEGAREALTSVKGAVASIASSRAELGATESRLATQFENLKTTEVNQFAARSQIEDADIATETANRTAASIRQQGSASLLGISNLQPQLALRLIGGTA